MMKARLISNGTGEYLLLCSDGTIAEANTAVLARFLRDSKNICDVSGSFDRWDNQVPYMLDYKGETVAYINDDGCIVISDFAPFERLFEVKPGFSADDFLTTAEYADEVGKSVEQVKMQLRNGRIPNACKKGRDWIIHKDSVMHYPADNRIVSGNYIGFRDKYGKAKKK